MLITVVLFIDYLSYATVNLRADCVSLMSKNYVLEAKSVTKSIIPELITIVMVQSINRKNRGCIILFIKE